MKILVLGASGMLGSAVFKLLLSDSEHNVRGTVRNDSGLRGMPREYQSSVIPNVDVLNIDCLTRVMSQFRPEVVINCTGLIKQDISSLDPLSVLPINSLLPHRLLQLCELSDARLIHISTDCVFSGNRGMYSEDDPSDATDLYGKSKFIGEVINSPNAITLRTSIIGHGLSSNRSLIDWFLAQQGEVKGFSKAIFSGLPTVELSKVIRDFVLPFPELHGLYHVSVAPIDKLSLLEIVSRVYKHDVSLIEDTNLKIDRSLNSSRFRAATGYEPRAWESLVVAMYESAKD